MEGGVEGYFSLLKRGVAGVYRHVGCHHLQHYLDEFDFRYNVRKETGIARAILTVQVSERKRLNGRFVICTITKYFVDLLYSAVYPNPPHEGLAKS